MAKQTSSPKTSDVEVAKAIKAHNLNRCECGCGAFVKGSYKQGHDARHVSKLVQLVVVDGAVTPDEAVDSLGSVALRAKLAKALNRAQAAFDKEAAKTAKTAQLQPEPAEIKVGRWWYPIVGVANNGVQYQTRDGSIKIASVDAQVR